MIHRRTVFALAFALATGAIATLIGTPAFAKANGYDTTVVEHSTGSFEKINDTTWKEYENGSNRGFATFEKTHEDDWSIYLHDSSRNVQIQLDMHRMMVLYGERNGAKRDLYKINNADNRVNGRSARFVDFGDGSFRKIGNEWIEFNSNGERHTVFVEKSRDMWSVYARDDSRNMDMQVDLHRNKIRLAWPGHHMADQYNIISSH